MSESFLISLIKGKTLGHAVSLLRSYFERLHLMINFDTSYLSEFVTSEEIERFQDKIDEVHNTLHFVSKDENDFKGWLGLPVKINTQELEKIKSCAKKIRRSSDIFVVIGIGGSYLGARAAIEFLNSTNYNYLSKNSPKIFFVGNSINSQELEDILEICEKKDVSINVISKSGKTTEPAVAFRIFKKFLEDKYGKEQAKDRIYCTTDPYEGSLLKIARQEGYERFEIPQNIGGRYSVLTPVGLLPLAVSGADIDEILSGARKSYEESLSKSLKINNCYKYAVLRNIFYKKGKNIELMTGYDSRLRYFFEWWKQLFGESEGKSGTGIFPATAVFTTDLHSMGQFIQEGNKILFETVIKAQNYDKGLVVPPCESNIDELNYLEGKKLNYINEKAFEATVLAHTSGGTPNIIIKIDNYSEYCLGYIIYFFEKACAVSSYLMNVNPFNQPGVEEYKANMFKLLGKPGC